jgi:hypothetical protein
MTMNNLSNTPGTSLHFDHERILEGCLGTTYTLENPSLK